MTREFAISLGTRHFDARAFGSDSNGTTLSHRVCRALFRIALSGADIDLIRETTNKNWVLGNERFKRQIEELAGRRASPARRGPQPASSSANRA